MDLEEIRTVGVEEGREACLQRLPQHIISSRMKNLKLRSLSPWGHVWLRSAPVGKEGRDLGTDSVV